VKEYFSASAVSPIISNLHCFKTRRVIIGVVCAVFAYAMTPIVHSGAQDKSSVPGSGKLEPLGPPASGGANPRGHERDDDLDGDDYGRVPTTPPQGSTDAKPPENQPVPVPPKKAEADTPAPPNKGEDDDEKDQQELDIAKRQLKIATDQKNEDAIKRIKDRISRVEKKIKDRGAGPKKLSEKQKRVKKAFDEQKESDKELEKAIEEQDKSDKTKQPATPKQKAAEPKKEEPKKAEPKKLTKDDDDALIDGDNLRETPKLPKRVPITDGPVVPTADVAAPTAGAAPECTSLTSLDDAQLKTMVADPKLRARLAKLIDMQQSEDTVRKRINKTESGNKKEKSVSKRRGRGNDDEPATANSRRTGGGLPPQAIDAIGTGIGIGIGSMRGRGSDDRMR
jgi:ribosomal protein S10